MFYMKRDEKEEFEDFIKNKVDEKSAILQKISLPDNNSNIKIYLKREDLLHPTISGNKWRKLKYNLIEAKRLGKDTLLTFGGAYSNHIHATASAGKIFGFKTIGIIRGEEHLPLNPTLDFAESQGMKIDYVDRKTYRKKNEKDFVKELYQKYGEIYLLPEGGTNSLAVKGCTEIIHGINIQFDYILSACGTGGTLAGLICGLKGESEIIGVPVLKGASFLYKDIDTHTRNYSNTTYTNWKLNLNFHFGGYAKIDKELILFIKKFEIQNGIELDPIYTGKLLYCINSMIKNCKFKEGSSIIALHTGGLQGNKGMQKIVDKLLS